MVGAKFKGIRGQFEGIGYPLEKTAEVVEDCGQFVQEIVDKFGPRFYLQEVEEQADIEEGKKVNKKVRTEGTFQDDGPCLDFSQDTRSKILNIFDDGCL